MTLICWMCWESLIERYMLGILGKWLFSILARIRLSLHLVRLGVGEVVRGRRREEGD